MTLRWFDGAEHSIDILIAGTSEKSMNEGFYLPDVYKRQAAVLGPGRAERTAPAERHPTR